MIYVASTTVHAPRWRALRAAGWPIISSWIDEPGLGGIKSLERLLVRTFDEVQLAWMTLVYREEGELLKGAFMELGASIAHQVPVFAVGCDDLSVIHHPLVIRHPSLESALEDIRVRLPLGQRSFSTVDFTSEGVAQ